MKKLFFILSIVYYNFSFCQCNQYIIKNYDKFEKKTTYETIKSLDLVGNGYGFSAKLTQNINGYNEVRIKVTNLSTRKAAVIGNKSKIILLFDNNETLERYNIWDGSFNGDSNELGLIVFMFGHQSFQYKKDLADLIDDHKKLFKENELTSIRFTNIGSINAYNNIDIDLTTEQKKYFMKVFECFN
ncbi:hypothetical protein [Aureispira anguillae]|uniref:Uncharacterized protein n=1 Tax=Aureispira anguillae TaxID=2864201 RepID=A0A916DU26_9BACT|nr:hypothetical protein [Aureispira anguillae]BDS12981.1 hypothetical protein AsAng_0037090 [Aureispira anguillae]